MGHGECSNSLRKRSDIRLVGESGDDDNCLLVGQSYEPAGVEFGLLGDILGKESIEF
jgi:hypothetical protein